MSRAERRERRERVVAKRVAEAGYVGAEAGRFSKAKAFAGENSMYVGGRYSFRIARYSATHTFEEFDY